MFLVIIFFCHCLFIFVFILLLLFRKIVTTLHVSFRGKLSDRSNFHYCGGFPFDNCNDLKNLHRNNLVDELNKQIT